MNIVVRTYSGKTLVRPDTSRDHNSEDAFIPEFIDSIGFTPVFTARICRAGKCVGPKFAGRYYDGAGFGILMYPTSLLDGSPESFAQASCLDHSSYLSLPSTPVAGEHSFRICRNGVEIFNSSPSQKTLDEAIVESSRFCFIRTGDYLAAELAPIAPLGSKADGKVHIEAYCNEIKILDYNIIF